VPGRLRGEADRARRIERGGIRAPAMEGTPRARQTRLDRTRCTSVAGNEMRDVRDAICLHAAPERVNRSGPPTASLWCNARR
jgi:hypothetical protein